MDAKTGEGKGRGGERARQGWMKSGSGLRDVFGRVYLCPVHWIMDDSCLRLLEEEEGRWTKMKVQ